MYKYHYHCLAIQQYFSAFKIYQTKQTYDLDKMGSQQK
jgi:hypothetical protein